MLDVKKIVVRGVNWLGDAVMSTPALARLREAAPRAHLAILTPVKLADLWREHPDLDEVLTFTPRESVLSVARRLRSSQFDLALIFPNSFRTGLEAFLARIPRRVGFSGQGRRWLLTQAVPPRSGAVKMRKRSAREIRSLVNSKQPLLQSAPVGSSAAWPAQAHHIHQYLHLVAALGASPAPCAPRIGLDLREVDQTLDRLNIPRTPGRPILGLNPGAEYGPAKRWPVAHFLEVAKRIQERTDCLWLIFGGKGDVDTAAVIASGLEQDRELAHGTSRGGPRAINLAGRTTLRELGALLKACRLLLTNDTGPMHLAAAVGTPVVVPFGSTSVALTGPGLPGDSSHRFLHAGVPCSPCFLRECPIDFRCMTGISVDRVVRAVLDLCPSP